MNKRFSVKVTVAGLAILALAGCGGAAATASHSAASPASSSQSVPTGDLQTEVMIHEQGLTVTWNMPASAMAGTQITGASLSNTTAGPDMYVLEMTTPAAAASFAAQLQQSAGPFTDAQGNDIGAVSVQVDGSAIYCSTDSTPDMTAFLHQLKASS